MSVIIVIKIWNCSYLAFGCDAKLQQIFFNIKKL